MTGAILLLLDSMNRTGFFPLTTYKPAMLLQAEAYVLGDLRASMATDELVDRITNGSLGNANEDRLIKTALARHAQTWRVFPDAQWLVITKAIDHGKLTLGQVERVWNQCVHSPRLFSTGRNDQTYLSGEEIKLVAGVRTRAGDRRKNSILTDHAFWVKEVLHISYKNDEGETHQINSKYGDGSFVPEKSKGPFAIADEQHSAQLLAPDSVGEYEGSIVYELSYNSISRNWPATDDQLEQLESLKHTYSFPITFRVVNPESIALPVIDPKSLREDTSSLVKFEATKVEPRYRRLRESQPKAQVRLWVNRSLDPAIGLGGHLFFEQGVHSLSVPINVQPREIDRFPVNLDGFSPGPVQVTYTHDHAIAVRERDRIPRVLGGPIDLGTITIPESE